ncbi:MAG: hypothetical protein FWC95_08245 [Defluviitaleaceae bacterium]|nr:hypothetical protein [Defluviitaleaceae bacterium]
MICIRKTKLAMFILAAIIAVMLFAFNVYACAECVDEFDVEISCRDITIRDLERFNVRPVINNIPHLDVNGVFRIERQIIEIGSQQVFTCPDDPSYIIVVTDNGMYDVRIDDLFAANIAHINLAARLLPNQQYLTVRYFTTERVPLEIFNANLYSEVRGRCAVGQHLGPIYILRIIDHWFHNHVGPRPWTCGITTTFYWACYACGVTGTESHITNIWCMGD